MCRRQTWGRTWRPPKNRRRARGAGAGVELRCGPSPDFDHPVDVPLHFGAGVLAPLSFSLRFAGMAVRNFGEAGMHLRPVVC